MIEQLGSVVRTPQAPRLTVGTTDVPRTDFSAVIASLEPKRGADSDGTGTHDAESEASQTETSGRSTNTEADPHRTEESDLPDDKTPVTHRPDGPAPTIDGSSEDAIAVISRRIPERSGNQSMIPPVADEAAGRADTSFAPSAGQGERISAAFAEPDHASKTRRPASPYAKPPLPSARTRQDVPNRAEASSRSRPPSIRSDDDAALPVRPETPDFVGGVAPVAERSHGLDTKAEDDRAAGSSRTASRATETPPLAAPPGQATRHGTSALQESAVVVRNHPAPKPRLDAATAARLGSAADLEPQRAVPGTPGVSEPIPESGHREGTPVELRVGAEFVAPTGETEARYPEPTVTRKNGTFGVEVQAGKAFETSLHAKVSDFPGQLERQSRKVTGNHDPSGDSVTDPVAGSRTAHTMAAAYPARVSNPDVRDTSIGKQSAVFFSVARHASIATATGPVHPSHVQSSVPALADQHSGATLSAEGATRAPRKIAGDRASAGPGAQQMSAMRRAEKRSDPPEMPLPAGRSLVTETVTTAPVPDLPKAQGPTAGSGPSAGAEMHRWPPLPQAQPAKPSATASDARPVAEPSPSTTPGVVSRAEDSRMLVPSGRLFAQSENGRAAQSLRPRPDRSASAPPVPGAAPTHGIDPPDAGPARRRESGVYPSARRDGPTSPTTRSDTKRAVHPGGTEKFQSGSASAKAISAPLTVSGLPGSGHSAAPPAEAFSTPHTLRDLIEPRRPEAADAARATGFQGSKMSSPVPRLDAKRFAPAQTVPVSSDVRTSESDLDPGPFAVAESRSAAVPPMPVQQASAAGPHAGAVIRQVMDVIVQARDGQMELRLNPEELGRVRLHFQPSEQGAMILTISAERPETLDLLRRNIDQLGRELAAMGYDNTSFNFGENRRGTGQSVADSHADTVETSPGPAADMPAGDTPISRPQDGLDLRL